MGKKDLTLKSYLSDPVRYADVYNGSVFKGVQVLDGTQLEEAQVVVVKAEGNVALEYDRQVKELRRMNAASCKAKQGKAAVRLSRGRVLPGSICTKSEKLTVSARSAH